MPDLTARVIGNNLTGNVTWSIAFTYSGPVAKTFSAAYPQPQPSNFALPASQPWSISGTMGSDIVGGSATIYWTYQPLPTQMFTFNVNGKNASQAAVKAYAITKTSFWALPKLIAQESSYRQFNSTSAEPADPFASFDGGYGLMQITNPPPTVSQVWSWKANVDEGVSRMNTALTTASNSDHWGWSAQRYRDYVTEHPELDPGEPVLAPPAPRYCTFSLNPDGINTHSWADAIGLKQYNSGGGTDDYVRWNDSLHKWDYNRTVGTHPDYVVDVCSHADTWQ